MRKVTHGEANQKIADDFRIEKWKDSRFFSLYEGNTLVAVMAYRRGASAVQARIEQLKSMIAEMTMKQNDLPGIKGESKGKQDWSGLRSAIQKSLRRGDLGLLKLAFSRLWENKTQRAWLLWRGIILAGEENEKFTAVAGRISFQKNPSREDVWKLLCNLALHPKEKECEAIRIVSHLISEQGWKAEEFVSGQRLDELKAWMAVQTKLGIAYTDRDKFWKFFIAPEGYPRETVSVCQKRFARGGMSCDKELLVVIAFLSTREKWEEPHLLDVPAESEIQEAPAVSWFCYDGHTSLGRLVHSQLRKVILDKQEWKYVTDDLQFNQESAEVDRLDESSFWWPLALKMIWKRYRKTGEEAQMDWLKWAPRVQKMIEEQIGGKDAKVWMPRMWAREGHGAPRF